MASNAVIEQSTQSNYFDVRVVHLEIALAVDFEAQRLSGQVTYSAEVRKEGATELVLDTNHLVIHGASIDGEAVPFLLKPEVDPFGRALCIPLSSAAVGSTVKVTVSYETTAESAALQWLTPEQTSGGLPFLFTQCQAIHARSMLPCQDSPGSKATYAASITVPHAATAVMSAITSNPPVTDGAAHTRTFFFAQRVPIASYLIALAVGRIESRRIGPRSFVYAEPALVDAAAAEFSETEAFVAAGEKLLGPYVWGEYNILVLPASFPYGGMENPTMTFVTPALVCGDKSLTDVVAHEIAHSWTGNLVTNATSNHFWLNEGFTMMVQRKILGLLHGDSAFDFDAISGELALTEAIRRFTDRGQMEFTKLVPDLPGIDPDDSFSSVPYEKGFYLLFYLHQLVGRVPFESFLFDYVQTFKYKSISSDDFVRYFTAYFTEGRHALPRVSTSGVPPLHTGSTGAPDPEDISALCVLNEGDAPVPSAGVSTSAAAAVHSIDVSAVDWEAWLHGVGGPPVKNTYEDTVRGLVSAHADLWVSDPAAAAGACGAITADWAATQWMAFMERLVEVSSALGARSPRAIIAPSTLRSLDAATHLSASRNSEIRLQWGILALRSGLEEHMAAVCAFLKEFGRMKYVRPLFCELLRSPHGRSLALELFASNKGSYHPICAKMVSVDIEKECAKAPADPASAVQFFGGAINSDEATAAQTPVQAPASAPAVAAASASKSSTASSLGVDIDDEAAVIQVEISVSRGVVVASVADDLGVGATDGALSAPPSCVVSTEESQSATAIDTSASSSSAAVDGEGEEGDEDDGEVEEEEASAAAPRRRIRFGAKRGAVRRSTTAAATATMPAASSPATSTSKPAVSVSSSPAAASSSSSPPAAAAAASSPSGSPSSSVIARVTGGAPAVAAKAAQLLKTAALIKSGVAPVAAARSAAAAQSTSSVKSSTGDDGEEGGSRGKDSSGIGFVSRVTAATQSASDYVKGVSVPEPLASILPPVLGVSIVVGVAAGIALLLLRGRRES